MIIGLDIGGTKMEAAVFDDAFVAIDRRRAATPGRDYATFLDSIAEFVAWGDEVAGGRSRVGIGFPGLINNLGRSLSANVPCATGRAVQSEISARLGRPIALCNDTHCFALSEAVGGAGADYSHVFGAILGTGAAGGMVVEGKLQRGHRQIAGEYGHLPLPALAAKAFDLPIWRCLCGLPNCLEPYIAGPGLLRLARHFGLSSESAADVVACWREDCPAAHLTHDCYFALLGSAFASVVKLNDPDVIVLGGGLSLVPDIVEHLPAAIEANLFSGFNSPPVLRARFGDSSGVRGAAILAAQELAK